MPILILEGLTGAGKSSTLAALAQQLAAAGASCRIVYEEESFGELMDELADPQSATDGHPGLCRRLEVILGELEAPVSPMPAWVILERFHPSYYALLPEWERYAAIDARLAALGAKLVLLGYPEDLIRTRALYRGEREAEGWSTGFIALYGSEQAALDALISSWRLRAEACERSAMPCLRLDTSDRDWDATAAAIRVWGTESAGAGSQES